MAKTKLKFTLIFFCFFLLIAGVFPAIRVYSSENIRFELTSAEREYLSTISDKPLRIAYSTDAMYTTVNGKSYGMIKPLVDVFEKEFGLKVFVQKHDWSDGFSALKYGYADFFGFVTLNEQRNNDYITVDTMISSVPQVISRIDNPVGGSPLFFQNRKVGLLSNSTPAKSLLTYILPHGEIVYFETIGKMINALENGDIDCFISLDNAQFEILENKQLNFEFSLENYRTNQGFICSNEELRPLVAILNRYIAFDKELPNRITQARHEAIIVAEKERFKSEIEFLNQKYNEIEFFGSGGTYPFFYEQDGKLMGLQAEISGIFEELTGLKVNHQSGKKYPNGVYSSFDAIKAGDCLASGAGYFNLDIFNDPSYSYSLPMWKDTIRAYSVGYVKGDLRELRVGTSIHAKGYVNWDVLYGKQPALYNSRKALIKALRNGEIDVAFMSEMSFNYLTIIEKDYSLYEYGDFSAEAALNLVYGAQNTQFNSLYDEAIKLNSALNPSHISDLMLKTERLKSDYIRIREEQKKFIEIVVIVFVLMLILLIYMLRRITVYDTQVSRLIRKQQTFDLAWGNLKTGKFVSKGDHPFFRKWGLQFSGPKIRMDELTKAFGWDLINDYKEDMENMGRQNIAFIATDKRVVSPIDGKIMYYRRFLHRLNDHEFMSCLQDITDEMTKEHELTQIASTDFLSNLLTRRAMTNNIVMKCTELREIGGNSFLIMIDIDDFKYVNDTYGHDVGDKVLIAVSDIIQGTQGCQTTTSRWGGEEFLVLLDCDDIKVAESRAQSIILSVSRAQIAFGENTISVTISAGLSQLDPYLEYTRSINRADKAMYKAKRSGKNCLRVI